VNIQDEKEGWLLTHTGKVHVTIYQLVTHSAATPALQLSLRREVPAIRKASSSTILGLGLATGFTHQEISF
jgi:hypothetical protein